MASVFDEDSADELDKYVGVFKVASYELTHLPLILHLARKGKPVILSTGTASMDEVIETIEELRKIGNDDLILMQCTAAYPAPVETLNLRAIAVMKSRFSVPVGLSDHSRDPLVGPLSAVAVGANLIEKHFTLSNELPGPDHRFALEPNELRMMVSKVRQAEMALGNGEKVVQPVEMELRAFARRSIFATRDIKKGELFTRENIAVLRCGDLTPGIEPKRYDEVLGKRATRDLQASSSVKGEDYA
jgi:N-acetylneuraminate synthase